MPNHRLNREALDIAGMGGYVSAHTVIAVNRKQLLRFFDERPPSSLHHATAIVAVAGEELGTGLFAHYLAGKGIQASVLPGPCTPGTRKGSRLDAWIDAGATLYQVEVKNWSAHAYGGNKQLPLDAPADVTAKYRSQRWSEIWDGHGFKGQSMSKVLSPMRPRRESANIQPLIIFWFAVHPEGSAEPFFQVPVQGASFATINGFSMSNYLRQSKEEVLFLEMPNAARRLEWLRTLFSMEKTFGDV